MASSRDAGGGGGGSSESRGSAGATASGEEMPGRLIMDQQRPVGSPQDLKKDRSQAQEVNSSHKRDFAQMQGTAHTNGPSNGLGNGQTLTNGVTGQHEASPTTNGHSNGQAPAVSSLPTPPPLDQSWRTSDANKPMGVMLQRLAQQCYGDLNDMVNTTSQMPPPQPTAANGVIPHANDPSRESVDRKRALLDFANGQRDRFIKALVLSDWARSEHDMAKLVDLKVWQEKQLMSQAAAMRYIGDTKHATVSAKMPNPNIEGAMELLATGKSSKWPDLAWIPPKKLSAKQLTRTIQDMNVTLATRLSLHEELPPNFRDYTIENGRTTFHVSGEFEVDLSVADEDPNSQFYMIDLRFMFAPTPNISDDALRNALEAKANDALSTKGLQGCYDFLHNFVLTHKIGVLRSQAAALFREKWFGCLIPETVRRVFAVQYWKDQAGKKSWVEFGISTGKSKGRLSRKVPVARHSVRWFRHGQEVQDDTIDIDWNNLDLDAILSQVTAKHASWILSTVQERFRTQAGSESTTTSDLSTSISSVDACKLLLSMPGLRVPVILQLEPVTGFMTVSPASRDATTAEHNFNRDLTSDNSSSLVQLLCRAVQQCVRKALTSSGWQIADPRGLHTQTNFKALFGQGIVRFDILVCNRGWGDWALCTTYSLSGQRWWAVRLKQIVEQGKTAKTITRALDIKVSATGLCRADLGRIQRLAEAEISFEVLEHDLKTNGIPHHLENLSPRTAQENGSILKEGRAVAMYIRLTDKDAKSSALAKYKSLAVTDWIRIAYQDIIDAEDEGANMRHDIRLNVDSGKLKKLHQHLTTSNLRDADIAMSGSGGLALSLSTPFGEPYVDRIVSLLNRCQELNEVLASAPKLHFTCTTIGLKKLDFSYGDRKQYSATLLTSGSSTVLKLTPTSSNPHRRIRVLLEKLYNKTVQHQFWSLGIFMNAVQPLLEAFIDLETAHAARNTVLIHSHDVSTHMIEYRAPLVPCRFRASLHWYVSEGKRREHKFTVTPHQKEGVELPAAFSDALDELSKNCGSTAEGWFGNNKGGYTTDPKGLTKVIQRLDDFMRKSDQADNGTASKVDKQEMTVPDAKPPLSRNPSKQSVPTQHTASHGSSQNLKLGKLKQEVIELD